MQMLKRRSIRVLDDVCGMKDFNYAEMIRDQFSELGDDPAKAFWHEVWEYLMYMQVKDADTPIVITDDPKAELSWERKK